MLSAQFPKRFYEATTEKQFQVKKNEFKLCQDETKTGLKLTS